MTPKTKENLDKMEELGINIRHFDYDSCVEILIDKYVEAFTSLEYEEEERFKKQLLSVTKTKTN